MHCHLHYPSLTEFKLHTHTQAATPQSEAQIEIHLYKEDKINNRHRNEYIPRFKSTSQFFVMMGREQRLSHRTENRPDGKISPGGDRFVWHSSTVLTDCQRDGEQLKRKHKTTGGLQSLALWRIDEKKTKSFLTKCLAEKRLRIQSWFSFHSAGSKRKDGGNSLESAHSLLLVLNLSGWEGSDTMKAEGSCYSCYLIGDCKGAPVCSQLAELRTWGRPSPCLVLVPMRMTMAKGRLCHLMISSLKHYNLLCLPLPPCHHSILHSSHTFSHEPLAFIFTDTHMIFSYQNIEKPSKMTHYVLLSLT